MTDLPERAIRRHDRNRIFRGLCGFFALLLTKQTKQTRETREPKETRKNLKLARFEELKVWQLAHRLSLDVAELVRTFPKDEKYDLIGQMRRSARSIPSDISEGFGRFHFNDKLTFYERARASLGELRNHFNEALGNRYITKETYSQYLKTMAEINYLLNRMMKGVQTARDLKEMDKKLKQSSSRRLTSNAKH
jgi:four helix bundle protein